MAQTTWKQAVHDIADAYREAEGITDKISIANLKEKVREGSSKVTLDGEKVKELAMTSYKGDNPLTLGQAGTSFPANTLLKDELSILNGVNGEDLTQTEADMASAIALLDAMVKRKVSENRGEGEYVWKKYEFYNITAVETSYAPVVFKVTAEVGDLSKVDETFFDGWTLTRSTGAYHVLNGDGTGRRVGSTGTASNFTWTYNPSDQTININYSWASASTSTTVQYNIPPDYINFVISNDSASYPNGGEQDGYWYAWYNDQDFIDRLIEEVNS